MTKSPECVLLFFQKLGYFSQQHKVFMARMEACQLSLP